MAIKRIDVSKKAKASRKKVRKEMRRTAYQNRGFNLPPTGALNENRNENKKETQTR